MSKTNKEKTEKDILLEINNKLGDVIALLLVSDKEKDEQIKILVSKGYTNSEISELLGIPIGTVSSIRTKQKSS